MSNFGPPGGGSPEPWGGRRPDDGYAPPADPRYDPGYGGQPGGWEEPPTRHYEPPAQRYDQSTPRYEPGPAWNAGPPPAAPPYQGYPADPGYGGQPPYAEPTPPRRGRGPLLVVLVVLAVLLLGGAGAYWFLGRDDAGEGGTASPSASAAAPTGAASDPAGAPTTPPAPASSTDPRFVKAGQCVANEGGSAEPKLVITDCAPKTYQVLRRIDGSTSGKKDAESKCAKVEGYTDWYFFDSRLDTLDFVLCLKRR
ncbi:flagellar basal body protein FliL [Micromonospora sp. MA102]|uniref:LppU/SCO3897 family protein n=1 Tax=Micromonospora sp. MA102 TaxID=2952755 RepID=UPI0021C68088|nr:flagellar basal body protein FliL [Micromonospora sp. MA102]